MTTSPRWEIDGRDWPNRAASRFIETERLRWHVQTMGEGPVLLLLHGTGAGTHSWRGLMPALAEHFSIIAPDLPGHAFTTGRPRDGLSLPAMAAAVTELLDTLDSRPAIIVGHSAGAAIAVQMNLAATVRAPVVGFNPALLPFPGLAARLFPAMAKMLFVNPLAPRIFARVARGSGEVERFLIRSTGSRIDAAGVESYARLLGKSGHVAGAIGMMANWDLEALKRKLPDLETQILLVHGEADTAVPESAVRNAAAIIRGAEMHTLEGFGHLAHEEAPDRAAAIIRRFATDHAILAVADIGAE